MHTMESDSGHDDVNELLELEQSTGNGRDHIQLGSCWLWPQILITLSERATDRPGATSTWLDDGYSISDGSATWTVTSTDPLIVLRVILMPQS